MPAPDPERLPALQSVAAAQLGRTIRPQAVTAFALDARLARIAAQGTEPMLTQMRLAWWRDQLALPIAERPQGDRVLDAIGRDWEGDESALSELVDGWEILAVSEALTAAIALDFAAKRAAPFAALAKLAGESTSAEDAKLAATRWALGDAAANVSSEAERAKLVEAAGKLPDRPARLPKSLRGLEILDRLAARSLDRGGVPMFADRGAALLAFRIGLLGS